MNDDGYDSLWHAQELERLFGSLAQPPQPPSDEQARKLQAAAYEQAFGSEAYYFDLLASGMPIDEIQEIEAIAFGGRTPSRAENEIPMGMRADLAAILKDF